MRNDLLNSVVAQVNSFHISSHVEYDYQNIRRRMIFESLTQGVHSVCDQQRRRRRDCRIRHVFRFQHVFHRTRDGGLLGDFCGIRGAAQCGEEITVPV